MDLEDISDSRVSRVSSVSSVVQVPSVRNSSIYLSWGFGEYDVFIGKEGFMSFASIEGL